MTRVNADPLVRAIEGKNIPIVACLSQTPDSPHTTFSTHSATLAWWGGALLDFGSKVQPSTARSTGESETPHVGELYTKVLRSRGLPNYTISS